jgi:hypothetical protein
LIGIATGTQSLGKGLLGFLGGIASRVGGVFLDKGFGFLDTAISGLFGGSTPKFAMGTVLPGYGGGDIIPAFLEPGEAVLRKEAVARLGRSQINTLNRTTNTGGITVNYNLPNANAMRPTRRQLAHDLTVQQQRYGSV